MKYNGESYMPIMEFIMDKQRIKVKEHSAG